MAATDAENFGKALQQIVEESAKFGYRPTRFQQMVGHRGPVAAVQRLLRDKTTAAAGLERLAKEGRLDLSIEALALQPQWRHHFTTSQLRTAEERLRKLGFDTSAIPPTQTPTKKDTDPSPRVTQMTPGDRASLEGSANIFRVTGPPENFITAMTIGWWAVNEGNKGQWARLQHGDVLLLHSTRNSDYSRNVISAVVGFARVGNRKEIKTGLWWVQEIEEHKNFWPYAFSLESIYLREDLSEVIDLSVSVDGKSKEKLREEVEALSESGVPIADLNDEAKARDSGYPAFPVNGSMSHLHEIYAELVFSRFSDAWYQCVGDFEDEDFSRELLSDADIESLEARSKEQLIEEAKRWLPGSDQRSTHGWRKTRKEDVRQKKRVAMIEDHTCQVCEFHCGYTDRRGRQRWIIHVDHIIEKAADGDESLGNLWVLCPNCHEQKTRGLITVDLAAKRILRLGEAIEIRDSHLFVT